MAIQRQTGKGKPTIWRSQRRFMNEGVDGYKRHGTTTLFAALNVLDGKVIGQCMSRHRHQEFIRFLNWIKRETTAGRQVHLIVDNYATHKHPKVRAWLGRYTHFHFHFTPTSASWLHTVEGVFAKLTRRPLKGGVFKGIADLQAAINRFLQETNANPKPFIWTTDPRRHHRKGSPRETSVSVNPPAPFDGEVNYDLFRAPP
jgi:transposase